MVIAREEGVAPPLPVGEDAGSGDGSLKRNIPAKHDFDPRALKPLARALFSSSVALGHSVTAYKEFTRLKSSSISPDGMIGGRGYVLKVRDLRAKLQQACELLSSITDTMYDEIQAPHWRPRLGELGANEAEDITEFIDEASEVLDDPEAFGEKELDEVEKQNDGPGGTPDDVRWKETPEGKADEASQVPTGGEVGNEAKPFGKAAPAKEASTKTANSSVSPSTLPGPRVDHFDPGNRTGPGGSYNKDEPAVQDDWGRSDGVGNDYDYESDWSNNLLDKSASGFVWGLTASGAAWGQTALPDANHDTTETDANDFGLGYGAKGKGTGGYGTKAPDGKGVYGPSSDLPSDPGAPTRDTEEGSGPYLDGVERNVWACAGGKCNCGGTCSCKSKLPTDDQPPVARSDYFEGDKGNQFNVNVHNGESLPGAGLPAKDTPLTPRPAHQGEHMFSESKMPGDGTPALYNYDRDTPDVGHTYERQDVPYVKYDWNTPNYRNDLQDVFNYEDVNRTDTNG